MPTPPRRSLLRSALLLLLLARGTLPADSAGAVTIAEWDIANATGQTAAVLATAPDVTASIIDSVGVTRWGSTGQDGFIVARGWAPGPAPDPGKYYEWTVTPALGFAVDYDTVSLALLRGIQGASHGAELWDLRASTDGFASSDLFLSTFDISASGADVQMPFLGVDISALGTQSAAVTFRLHGYDYTSPSDYSGLGNDDGTWLIYGTGANVVIQGSVVTTPEPSPALLVATGLVLLPARRRG